MKPDFVFQKILLGIAVASTLVGIGLPVFVMGLGLKLPPAAGWLTVLALPFIALVAMGSAALFLVVRLVQKDGLGTGAIVFAIAAALAVPLAVGWMWLSARASRDPVREARQTQLSTLASSNPTAFFEFIDTLAPLDQRYRDQIQTLLIYRGFRLANVELVRAYFERGTKHIETGPWIAKCLLTGMEEAAADKSPEAHARIQAVMAEVRRAYPVAFTEQVEYSGLTNTLEKVAQHRAHNRFAADAAMFRTNLLKILEAPPKAP